MKETVYSPLYHHRDRIISEESVINKKHRSLPAKRCMRIYPEKQKRAKRAFSYSGGSIRDTWWLHADNTMNKNVGEYVSDIPALPIRKKRKSSKGKSPQMKTFPMVDKGENVLEDSLQVIVNKIDGFKEVCDMSKFEDFQYLLSLQTALPSLYSDVRSDNAFIVAVASGNIASHKKRIKKCILWNRYSLEESTVAVEIENLLVEIDRWLGKLQQSINKPSDMSQQTSWKEDARNFEQQALHLSNNGVSNKLYTLLKSVANYMMKETKVSRCVVFNVPVDKLEQNELWIQSFLDYLYDDLRAAGIQIILDEEWDGQQKNEQQPCVLIGSKSLLAACRKSDVLSGMRQKSDIAKHSLFFPLLLSGEVKNSFPNKYHSCKNIIVFHDKGYVRSLKELIATLYGISDHEKEGYSALWREFIEEFPLFVDGMTEKQVHKIQRKIKEEEHSKQERIKKYSNFYTNLPKRNPKFTGRIDLLKNIYSTLNGTAESPQSEMIYISGGAGIGKTQLVNEYSYRHRQEYALIWWFNVANLMIDYQKLAKTLGIEMEKASGDQVMIAAHEKLMQMPNWLCIYDDAKSMLHLRAAMSYQEFPHHATPSTKRHIIITSRNANCWDVSFFNHQLYHIKMPSFTAMEAKDYISSYTNQQVDSSTLGELLGYHPLALTQAVTFIKHKKCSIAEYIELFEENKALLEEKEIEKMLSYDKKHTFSTAINQCLDNVISDDKNIRKSITSDMLCFSALCYHQNISAHIFTVWGNTYYQYRDISSILTKFMTYSLLDKQPPSEGMAIASEAFYAIHPAVQMVIRNRLNWKYVGDVIEKGANTLVTLLPKILNESLAEKKIKIFLPHALSVLSNYGSYSKDETVRPDLRELGTCIDNLLSEIKGLHISEEKKKWDSILEIGAKVVSGERYRKAADAASNINTIYTILNQYLPINSRKAMIQNIECDDPIQYGNTTSGGQISANNSGFFKKSIETDGTENIKKKHILQENLTNVIKQIKDLKAYIAGVPLLEGNLSVKYLVSVGEELQKLSSRMQSANHSELLNPSFNITLQKQLLQEELRNLLKSDLPYHYKSPLKDIFSETLTTLEQVESSIQEDVQVLGDVSTNNTDSVKKFREAGGAEHIKKKHILQENLTNVIKQIKDLKAAGVPLLEGNPSIKYLVSVGEELQKLSNQMQSANHSELLSPSFNITSQKQLLQEELRNLLKSDLPYHHKKTLEDIFSKTLTTLEQVESSIQEDVQVLGDVSTNNTDSVKKFREVGGIEHILPKQVLQENLTNMVKSINDFTAYALTNIKLIGNHFVNVLTSVGEALYTLSNSFFPPVKVVSTIKLQKAVLQKELRNLLKSDLQYRYKEPLKEIFSETLTTLEKVQCTHTKPDANSSHVAKLTGRASALMITDGEAMEEEKQAAKVTAERALKSEHKGR